MSDTSTRWREPALILLAALAVHLAWLTRPLTVVFDEVYFGRYAMAYLLGQDYFDVHPPLAKLLLGGTAWLLGLDPQFSWSGNGLAFPDASYALLRLPAHVAGVLLPLALWALARELGLSRPAALLAGGLVVLDNAWLVMTRLVLTDVFFILPGFAALWAWLRQRRSRRPGFLWLAAVLAGAAVSVKWTALSFLGLLWGLEALRLWRVGRLRRAQRLGITADQAVDRPADQAAQPGAQAWALWRPAVLLLVPVLVYIASFGVHFALVRPAPGADAEMVARAQMPVVERFVALNQAMWRTSSGMRVKHPYASRWYDWPFMLRTVDFWAQYRDDVGRLSRIYLLGNPVVWWTSGYALLYLLVNFVPRWVGDWKRAGGGGAVAGGPDGVTSTEWLLVAGCLANLVPFTLIGRVMFVYHYLPALGFAVLTLAWLVDRTGPHRHWLVPALLGAAAVAFVYFAPLSYGLEISRAQFDARFWVDSWR